MRRITRKDEKILRNKAGSFTVVDTRKDGVKFTSRELKPVAESFKRLDELYEETQSTLVAKVQHLEGHCKVPVVTSACSQVMEIIATYAPAVEQLCEVVAEIDVSFNHYPCDVVPFCTSPFRSVGLELSVALLTHATGAGCRCWWLWHTSLPMRPPPMRGPS